MLFVPGADALSQLHHDKLDTSDGLHGDVLKWEVGHRGQGTCPVESEGVCLL